MLTANYRSGDDFVVEFLGHRFEFNADDFEERVTAPPCASRSSSRTTSTTTRRAISSSSSPTDASSIRRAGWACYLVRHWEQISLVDGESLVYWLRKLVFRGAWLDHRVKEGLLDVNWLEDTGEFGYADPEGGRALLELAPVPSWRELQYRG